MRFFKWLLLGTITLLVGGWVCRGPLFRSIVRYHVVGERAAIKKDGAPGSVAAKVDGILQAALDTTADRLHFSTGRVTSDPRELVPGSAANCIGYAALFAALVEEDLARAELADRYAVQQVVSKLHIGSWNMHSLFDDPFWKDHDIVRITDKATGTTILIDPVLYDVAGIDRVQGGP